MQKLLTGLILTGLTVNVFGSDSNTSTSTNNKVQTQAIIEKKNISVGSLLPALEAFKKNTISTADLIELQKNIEQVKSHGNNSIDKILLNAMLCRAQVTEEDILSININGFLKRSLEETKKLQELTNSNSSPRPSKLKWFISGAMSAVTVALVVLAFGNPDSDDSEKTAASDSNN